jgi:penicillin amidase
MQLDNVSCRAQVWTPVIISACAGSAELKPALAAFNNWDCAIASNSPAATLFNSFYRHLVQNVLENKVGPRLYAELQAPYQLYIPDRLLTRIVNDGDNAVYDDVSTPGVKEKRDDMVVKSMKDAVAELSARLGPDPAKWEWGRVHEMTFKHPLGSKLPFYNLSPIPTSGDGFTINAGMWDSKNPYAMDSGGVIRLVADMSDLDSSTIMSPPGQSGLLLSPYYADLARDWAAGRQIPTHFLSPGSLTSLLLLQP